MRVKMTDKCERCDETMKISDVKVEDDLIMAEYICDCGYIQYKILDEILYCMSEGRL